MSDLSRQFLIVNKRGLHARASAKFVQMVESFDAKIIVSKDGMSVGGTSIMGLMMLGAAMGDTIVIHCDGVYADQALEKLVTLVENRFGED
jgi:phosphocarrier protein